MARTEWLDTIRQRPRVRASATAKESGLHGGRGAHPRARHRRDSAIFSVVYSVLLKPLPIPTRDRIVRLGQRDGRDEKCKFRSATTMTWRTQATAFDADGRDLVAAARHAHRQGRSDADPRAVGRRPTTGRCCSFRPSPAGTSPRPRIAGAPNVVVLSYALWQNRVQRRPRPSSAGRSRSTAQPYTVVGVAPRANSARPARGTRLASARAAGMAAHRLRRPRAARLWLAQAGRRANGRDATGHADRARGWRTSIRTAAMTEGHRAAADRRRRRAPTAKHCTCCSAPWRSCC